MNSVIGTGDLLEGAADDVKDGGGRGGAHGGGEGGEDVRAAARATVGDAQVGQVATGLRKPAADRRVDRNKQLVSITWPWVKVL